MQGGVPVIVVYVPKPDKAAELDQLTREHVTTLRRLGLATDMPALVFRSRDGAIVEVFEWVSEKAIEQAHANPEILAMWQRYDECCTFGTLAGLPESGDLFASFKRFDD